MTYTNDTYIFLHDIHFYAFHGISKQERTVGNDFTIDICLECDIHKACSTDNINDTVSYADVYKVLKEEMAIPSNLLEHVCQKIVDRLFEKFDKIEKIDIRLAKRNPPMNADIADAGVKMTCKRD